MITLNHKVSHEVAGFQRKLGKSLGVIGEVGGSPYNYLKCKVMMQSLLFVTDSQNKFILFLL